MKERISWIDGLRGIACIGVFIYHFVRYVFPATYSGQMDDVKVGEIETYFANSPFSIIINGNFFVCLFLIISAFVLSIQVAKANSKREIAIISFKRYPRLAIPVIIIGIISFVVGKSLLLFGFDAHIPAQNLSILKLIKVLIFDTWFIGSQQVLSVFWMLSILFYGSFITIIITSIVSSVNKPYTILLICSFFVGLINVYYLSFTIGVFIGLIFENKRENIEKIRKSKSLKKYVLMFLLVVVGIVAGGYPSFMLYPSGDASNFQLGVYEIFSVLPSVVFNSSHLFHIIGAACIMTAVMFSNIIQNFLNLRIVQYFGKISFSLYIIHKLVLYLVFPVIYRFGTTPLNYGLLSLLLFVISLAVVTLCSWLFQKYIEKPCNNIINKMVKKLFIIQQ